MPTGADPPDVDVTRLLQAADWRVQLTEREETTTAAFERWLTEDPGNLLAWEQVEAPWRDVGLWANAPQLLEAQANALARAREVGLARLAPVRVSRRAIGAGLVAGVGLLAGAGWFVMRPRTYQTRIGERRTVHLGDGSTLALDAASQVDVQYSNQRRSLTLVRGQARFDVAKDPLRPFVVRAGDRTVVALGTSFNVEILARAVLVTLLERRVSVLTTPTGLSLKPAARDHPANGLALSAGQRLEAATDQPAAAPKVETANIPRATAWERGKLDFDDEPLANVAERVGRYTPGGVRIDDRQVADLRISGVFDAGDVPTFVDAITHYLPVSATTSDSGEIRLQLRPSD